MELAADHGMLPPQEEMRGSSYDSRCDDMKRSAHHIHGGVILPEAILSDTHAEKPEEFTEIDTRLPHTHTEKPEEFTEIDTGLPHLEVVLKGEVTPEKSERDGSTMLGKPTNNELSQMGLMIY